MKTNLLKFAIVLLFFLTCSTRDTIHAQILQNALLGDTTVGSGSNNFINNSNEGSNKKKTTITLNNQTNKENNKNKENNSNQNNSQNASNNQNQQNNPNQQNSNQDNNQDADNERNTNNQNQNRNQENNNNANQNQHGISKEYIGEYYGTGRGWEVRFKHTSGDFVSQFSGINKDELPYGKDKVIMTLLVEHATSFKINIDGNGEVTGDGEIVYNVLPNLCGLAILTEQVNQAVNLMGEFTFFYDLSSKIGQASVATFEGTFLGLEGTLAKNLKNVAETGLSLGYEYLGTVLPDKMKSLDLLMQQNNSLCNCAAGQAALTGGSSVGPATIKEMIGTFGVDVAKTLFMDIATGSLPVGLMLSIPGVTQVQYYYKGLQNGPETRRFNIKGKFVNGELFLNMDGNVFEGPERLTIEYMVNYKKETPTFPTWSPFLQKAAIMQPNGSVTTITEQVTKIRQAKYTDAVTGETKTIDVPYVESTETKETLPFPFATFREAGKQRNGVKVWHEYEYNWSVYKVPEVK